MKRDDFIELAKKQRKVLYHEGKGLWFFPSELEKYNKEGRYVNMTKYQLRDAHEYLESVDRQINRVKNELENKHTTYSKDRLKHQKWLLISKRYYIKNKMEGLYE